MHFYLPSLHVLLISGEWRGQIETGTSENRVAVHTVKQAPGL